MLVSVGCQGTSLPQSPLEEGDLSNAVVKVEAETGGSELPTRRRSVGMLTRIGSPERLVRVLLVTFYLYPTLKAFQFSTTWSGPGATVVRRLGQLRAHAHGS